MTRARTGDVAPLAGLGTALSGAGHDVTVASFAMFEELVSGCGLRFQLIPGDPQVLQASPQGQRWQERGTGPISAIRFARLVGGLMRDVNAAILGAARQDSAWIAPPGRYQQLTVNPVDYGHLTGVAPQLAARAGGAATAS